jgi:gamma-glutamylcyclotransferase (GGCT)/AIG2-like uncharacterized protein YtfP
MAENILYFSYGHNTNIGEMLKRIPEAKLLGRASVHGYKFSLEHFSNIQPDKNSSIEGVLYSIPKNVVPTLDFLEDHRTHYKHITLPVNYGGKIVKAYAYQMFSNYQDKKLPTRKYINFIAQGYRQNKIPLNQLTAALQDRLNRHKNKS